MGFTCEICDDATGDRLAIEEYDAIPQPGFYIQFGETLTPVKKVLLKPSPSRRDAVITDDYTVVVYV